MRLTRSLYIAVAVLMFIVSLPQSVAAQANNEPTGYQHVTLWINPEYDQHGLLVMLEGQIMGAQIPATVKFLVPTTAVLNSAGSIDVQGGYSGGPPARNHSEVQGWDEISYEATSKTFRVEYYDPIIIGDSDKTISYEFLSIYPISDLGVWVQQPTSSTNFIVSPIGQMLDDSEGFTAYYYTYATLKERAPLDFNISYSKADKRPSLAIMGRITDTITDTTTAKGEPNSLPLILIPTGLGVLLLAIILISRRKIIMKSRVRHPLKPRLVTKKQGNKGEEVYCRTCGGEIEGLFVFCPYCGANRTDKKRSKTT